MTKHNSIKLTVSQYDDPRRSFFFDFCAMKSHFSYIDSLAGDYIPYQVDRPTGVRILTFYMYLNDVEEGGGRSQ